MESHRQTMQALAIDRWGDVGSVRELPIPAVGANEILLHVRAAGVNPIDVKIRDGKKSIGHVRWPHALGQDAAATVAGVGEAVTMYAVGDEVFGAFWLAGTFAEFVTTTPSQVVISRTPRNLDVVLAAALPTPALAAQSAMEAIDLRADETVLVVGATGAVGSLVVQLAARRGAYVVATSRASDAPRMRRLGATHVVDHTQGDLVNLVKEAYPNGIEALVDLVSGRDVLAHVATVLRSGGRLASSVHSADASTMAARGVRATNLDVFGSTGTLDALTRTMAEQPLTISVDRKVPLAGAVEALDAVASGHARGKIVLTMPGLRT